MADPKACFFDVNQYSHSDGYVKECIESGYAGRVGHYVDSCTSFISKMYKADCVMVANGTLALELALRTVDVRCGDVVIVPNVSFVATVNAVLSVGAIPAFMANRMDDVFPDIESLHYLLSRHKPKAIIVANLYGCPTPELGKIRAICDNLGIALIEDCAQSFGSFYEDKTPVGCYGDISTFSFFSNKTIACGQGGALVFKNPLLYTKALSISNHGRSKNDFDSYGTNYSFNNISAALLWGNLENMYTILDYRNNIYDEYLFQIRRMNVKVIPFKIEHNFAKWMLPLKLTEANPNKVVSRMTEMGFACRLGMQFLPLLPHIKDTRCTYKGERPDHILLPIHTGLKKSDIIEITNRLKMEIQ